MCHPLPMPLGPSHRGCHSTHRDHCDAMTIILCYIVLKRVHRVLVAHTNSVSCVLLLGVAVVVIMVMVVVMVVVVVELVVVELGNDGQAQQVRL